MSSLHYSIFFKKRVARAKSWCLYCRRRAKAHTLKKSKTILTIFHPKSLETLLSANWQWNFFSLQEIRACSGYNCRIGSQPPRWCPPGIDFAGQNGSYYPEGKPVRHFLGGIQGSANFISGITVFSQFQFPKLHILFHKRLLGMRIPWEVGSWYCSILALSTKPHQDHLPSKESN